MFELFDSFGKLEHASVCVYEFRLIVASDLAMFGFLGAGAKGIAQIEPRFPGKPRLRRNFALPVPAFPVSPLPVWHHSNALQWIPGRTTEDRISTGYWHLERFLRCRPATRLTPSQAGRHPKRHSLGSVPGPVPDPFRRHKRSAASLALLVHRSLCRSCHHLNAECRCPFNAFELHPKIIFQWYANRHSFTRPLKRQSGRFAYATLWTSISFQPKPQTRPQTVRAKRCSVRIQPHRSRDRR